MVKRTPLNVTWHLHCVSSSLSAPAVLTCGIRQTFEVHKCLVNNGCTLYFFLLSQIRRYLVSPILSLGRTRVWHSPLQTSTAPQTPCHGHNLTLDTHISSYLPLDTRISSYIPLDTCISSYIPLDTRISSYLPLDTHISSYLPLDTHISSYPFSNCTLRIFMICNFHQVGTLSGRNQGR